MAFEFAILQTDETLSIKPNLLVGERARVDGVELRRGRPPPSVAHPLTISIYTYIYTYMHTLNACIYIHNCIHK